MQQGDPYSRRLKGQRETVCRKNSDESLKLLYRHRRTFCLGRDPLPSDTQDRAFPLALDIHEKPSVELRVPALTTLCAFTHVAIIGCR